MAKSSPCAVPAPGIGDMELRGATLYSTLQPCGMCSMASIWAKIGRIVYGAERHQVHRMYFEDRHLDTLDIIRDAWRDDITIEGGLLADECAALYIGPNEISPKRSRPISERAPSRAVLITGAGRRIGAAMARMLAEDGWRVVVAHYNSSRSEAAALAADIIEAGGACETIHADLSDHAAAAA